MDISLVIFLSVVIIFAFRGYRSGVYIALTKIASYLLAYLVTFLYAKPASLIVQSFLSLTGLLSYIVACILLFVLTSFVISMIFNIILKLIGKSAEKSKLSSVSGGLLGATVGIVFGFLAVWFYSTTQELINAKKSLPPIAQSQFQQFAKNITTTAVKTLVSGISDNPEINAVSSALIINPVENIERYKRLNNSGDLQKLFHNESAITAMTNLNPNQLMQSNAFNNLMTNPDFVALTKEFNLPEEPKAMQKDVAVKLTTAWAQINQVKNDPEFIAITQDPEVRQMFERKDILGLLNNNKVEELLKLVTSAKTPDLNFNDIEEDQSTTSKAIQEVTPTIYSWVDENGKIQYSDKPKED